MDEAKKTNKIRGKAFFKKYFSGRVIDIGAGEDLVCEGAERFDQEDGDANHITTHRQLNAYDTVHSSHCLEHMYEPKKALLEWWKLIKPGGYLVLVVPDEDLYEQGFWPSKFNSDHKATFTLNNEKSWSPVSFNIFDLVSSLPNSEIISVEIQDKYYDYSLQTKLPLSQIVKKYPLWYRGFRRITKKLRMGNALLEKFQNQLFLSHQIPIDQTMRNAVAQIQILAKCTK
jgi:SAM-dependent methyltransferase